MQLPNTSGISNTNNLFYSFVVMQDSNNKFTLNNAKYVYLNSPNFVQLTIADIQKDINIQNIARYLLLQNYSMLSPSSKVIYVARDFPYYKIIFDGYQHIQITIIATFNVYTNKV